MNPNANELHFPLSEVKTITNKWLYLEDDGILDVMVGIMIANKLSGDPNWLLVVGPPSHAKTEILRSLDGHPDAYFLSNLTPSTLVSGILPKKNLPDPSLLPKLDGKTLVLKDFTSILAMRSENQQEILSQLREIYDGKYVKDFGNGKHVDWSGHVGLIGAVTPVYDKHYSVISSLGDRFLLYRTHNSDGEKMGIQAQLIVGREEQMRSEIREAVHKFLAQFEKPQGTQFEKDDNTNKMIVKLAQFVAYGRCPVDRDYRDQHIQYIPEPEGPPRVVKQLMQLGAGLALAHQKRRIDLELYEIIKKVGRDLLPAHRLRILEHLFKEKTIQFAKSWQKTKEVAEAVAMPAKTTKLALEDLMVVGLLNRRVDGGSETSPYLWQLKDFSYDLITSAEVFEVSKEVLN